MVVVWLLLPFLLLAAAPCWIMRRMRHWALANANHLDPAVIWFGHLRAITAISTTLWLAWLGLVVSLDPWRNLANALLIHDPFVHALLWNGLAILPPAAVLVICDGIAHPIVARIRGLDFTLWETVRDSLQVRFLLTIPGVCIFSGIAAFDGNRRITGAVTMTGGVLFLLLMFLLIIRRNRRMNLVSHALSFGALRDRAFALAERARVKLGEVYLLPMGRLQLANAFAAEGNHLILTDWLLKHCSRREVDAVIAHELGHMKHGHAGKLSWMGLLIVIFPIIALQFPEVQRSLNLAWVAFAMMVGLNLNKLVVHMYSRRCEGQADKEAVAISQDPEALITGLLRLDRLNFLPHQWDKLTENVVTHPSTARRITSIAAEGGVPPERMATLLQPMKVADQYPLPPTLQTMVDRGEQPVFGPHVKSRILLCSAIWLMVSVVLPPLAVAWMLARQTWDEPWRSLFYSMGILICFLAILLMTNRAGRTAITRLGTRLRARLEQKEFSFPPDQGCYVGFSPHDGPRVYQDAYDWDLGFLLLQGDYLIYLGEQTQFKLHRNEIRGVRIGPGEPNWLSSKRVYVEWMQGTFNFGLAHLGSLSETKIAAAQLADRLRRWWENQSAETGASGLAEKLETPRFGEVTHKSPKADATLARFFLAFCMLIALEIFLVDNTGLARVSPLDALYALVLVLPGTVALFWPTWKLR